jgi:hypothetical protein
MTLRISLVNEQHGYTIRLEEVEYHHAADGGPIEQARTVATLAIIDERSAALEAFDALNNLIQNLIGSKHIPEDLFRHRSLTIISNYLTSLSV